MLIQSGLMQLTRAGVQVFIGFSYALSAKLETVYVFVCGREGDRGREEREKGGGGGGERDRPRDRETERQRERERARARVCVGS